MCVVPDDHGHVEPEELELVADDVGEERLDVRVEVPAGVGRRLAASYSWDAAAQAHLDLYATLTRVAAIG